MKGSPTRGNKWREIKTLTKKIKKKIIKKMKMEMKWN